MKKIIKTFLFIFWLILIYSLSAENGSQSSNLSNGLLVVIARYLRINDVETFVKDFGFIIRKIAHFSEYFVLYILTYECFKEYKIANYQLVSLIFCIIYASFDEFHQLFVDGRSGQIKDVVIDSCGSLLSCFIWRLIRKDE